MSFESTDTERAALAERVAFSVRRALKIVGPTDSEVGTPEQVEAVEATS